MPRIIDLPLANPTLHRSQRVAYLAPQFLHLSLQTLDAPADSLFPTLIHHLHSPVPTIRARPPKPDLENNGVEPEVYSQKQAHQQVDQGRPTNQDHQHYCPPRQALRATTFPPHKLPPMPHLLTL